MYTGQKSVLSIQIDVFFKYLDGVKKQDVLDFAMKIYPVLSSQEAYISLYSAIKRQVTTARGKGVAIGEIANELIAKAYLAGEKLGDKFATLIMEEPQFLVRFQNNYRGHLKNSNIVQKPSQQQEEKKQVPQLQQNSRTVIQPQKNQKNSDNHFPLNFLHSTMQQKPTPVSSPLRSNELFLDSPLINPKSPELLSSHNFQSTSVYKIGVRPGEKILQKREQKVGEINSKYFDDNKKSISKQKWYENIREKLMEEEEKKAAQKQAAERQAAERQRSQLEQRIDIITQKKKNDIDRLLNKIEDPLTSAKPVTHSPSKQSPFFTSQSINPSKNSFLFPPPSQTKPTQFFQPTKPSKQPRFIDSNYIPNLSLRRQCLCQTLCQNIVLSEDSFYCQHCENIYHTRCMRKQTDSRNCVVCHLKLMTPNKVVTHELFVGLLKKNKKRHEISVQLSDELVDFLRSKKDFEYKLQLRCFRLKPQTQNQTLFPDSCTVTINGKQLKEFKPLHKQSSLKYRRDEPISILRHYQSDQNKIVINEYHNSNGQDRIEPEDHLIGLYVVEEETLNNTVQRIIRNFGTTLSESKELLNKAFNVGEKSADDMSEEQAITCEVVKIPMTCALTTQKLNYPARGVFCKHFQCFDLKNYIMMTSQSQNPRWVCPICKSSCYQFRVDCILTEILNQYTGCDKVDVLVLYKDGMYEVIDREENSIDEKGVKLKQPQPKSIDELNIVDRFKRGRGKDAQKEYEEEGNEKKKKKIVELPPEDQIIDLLSEDD